MTVSSLRAIRSLSRLGKILDSFTIAAIFLLAMAFDNVNPQFMAEKLAAEEYRENVRKEMVRIAQGILSREIEMVSGCRILEELVPADMEEVFMSIKGFVSETDIFPLGEARAGYESSYLASLDAQREKYSEQSKPWIFEACQEIIWHFRSV